MNYQAPQLIAIKGLNPIEQLMEMNLSRPPGILGIVDILEEKQKMAFRRNGRGTKTAVVGSGILNRDEVGDVLIAGGMRFQSAGDQENHGSLGVFEFRLANAPPQLDPAPAVQAKQCSLVRICIPANSSKSRSQSDSGLPFLSCIPSC